MRKLLCTLFGHKWGQNADPHGKTSWYDRCPRCKRCVLRPMSIAFRDKDQSGESEEMELLNWLGENRSLELSFCEVDSDLSDCAWCVHQVLGGRNDREWTLIATGETPREAIANAKQALSRYPDNVQGDGQ